MDRREQTAAELADLVAWTAPQRAVPDWPAIERAVGARLPVDYREYAARFPTGEFQTYLTVPMPTAAGLSPELPELRRMLERSARDLPDAPYRVFPEPGGLLPWGYIAVDEIFCWDTTGEDPDQWDTVVCTIDLEETERYHGTMTACVADLVRGTSGLRIGAMDELSELDPVFQPAIEDARTRGEAVADPDYWRDAHTSLPFEEPRDGVAQLSELLPDPRGTAEIEWSAVEARLGTPLPDDYKRLAQRLGPGGVGAVRLTTPNATDPALDLETFVASVHRRGLERRSTLAATYDHPYFPEVGGLIPWGRTSGGWTLAWLPVGDPAEWPVVALDPTWSSAEFFPFTTSGFLCHHLTHPAWMEQNTNDASWRVPE